MRKPEHPRRSVRKIDQYVIDYACEDACVKVTNVKSLKKCCQGRGGGGGGGEATKCPQEHPACTELLCRSEEGTSINRLWSPKAYGLMGQ